VVEGLVDFDVAIAAATRPSDFQLQMRTLAGGGPTARGGSPPNTEAVAEPIEPSAAGISSGFDFFGS